MKEPDTTNRFLVGVAGADIVLLRPVPQRLSKDDALNLAAYLAVLADFTGEEFSALIQAIRRT